jgi:hypothetical protein
VRFGNDRFREERRASNDDEDEDDDDDGDGMDFLISSRTTAREAEKAMDST